MGRDPFKGHRFPQAIILQAVRWYCRFPLSYRDVCDLLAERGVDADRATVFRWVQKFGPEIAKRSYSLRIRNAPRPIHCFTKPNGWPLAWRKSDRRMPFRAGPLATVDRRGRCAYA